MRSQDSLLLLESAVRERRSEQHAVKKEQCSRPSKSSVSAEAITSDGEKSNFGDVWVILQISSSTVFSDKYLEESTNIFFIFWSN